ncbi:MAG TPA: hypothetical protein V6D27_01500 [Vampirovibrionales bacterium]
MNGNIYLPFRNQTGDDLSKKMAYFSPEKIGLYDFAKTADPLMKTRIKSKRFGLGFKAINPSKTESITPGSKPRRRAGHLTKKGESSR